MFKISKVIKWLTSLIIAIYLSIFQYIIASAEQNLIGNMGTYPEAVNQYIQTNEGISNTNKSDLLNKYKKLKSYYGETGDIDSQDNEEQSEEKKNKNFYVKQLRKSDLEKEYESRIQGLQVSVKQFGYEFFQGKPVVNTNAPVSKDYTVGVGDKLVIYIKDTSISPNLPGVLKLTVNRNGEIYIPDIGTFYVVGARLGEIEDLLTSAIGSSVSVSLAGLRGFTVYVSGEVYRPGAVKVSNLNTVLDALMLAGGVKKTGSLRNIVLTRTTGEKIELDLYKLLVFGKPINIRLRDGDVILVRPIGKTVAIIGKVKRPAIYEIKGGERIKDVINLAGGLLPSSYKYKVILQRYVNHKYLKIETGNLDNENFIGKKVKSGDVIEIKSIINAPLNSIEIKGYTPYPGLYELKPGMYLSDILKPDMFFKDSNMNFALIERISRTGEPVEYITFSPNKIINHEKDILLYSGDIITLYKSGDVQSIDFDKVKDAVILKGEVKYPGVYAYEKDLTLSKLITYENIRMNTNLDYAEIERRNPYTLEVQKIIIFSPRDILTGKKDIKLHKLDVIKLFPRYVYAPIKVSGFIEKPYIVSYRDGLKLSDALYKAKFKEKIENLVVEIYRTFTKKKKGSIETAESVKVSAKENTYSKFFKKVYLYDLLIKNDETKNIKLNPGDRLVIKRINKNEIVKKVYIGGYVAKPGVYDISKYPTLYDVLKAAGGFRKDAYPKGLIFLRERIARIQSEKLKLAVNLMKQELLKEESGMIRADISSTEQKGLEASYKARMKFLDTLKETQITGRLSGIKLSYNLEKLKNSPFNIKLEDGDKIYIPFIPNDIYIFGEVFNPSTLVYMKGLTVEDYIKLAGGLTKYADKDNIFVIKADGTTISSQSSKSLIKWDTTHKRFVWGGYYNDILSYKLEPGDAIIVPTEIKVPTMWRPLLKDVLQILYQSILSAYMIKRL